MKRFIAAAGLALVAIFPAGCSTGTTVPLAERRPGGDPETVKLYAAPPSKYEVLGLVEATASGMTMQGEINSAIAKLKKKAAEMGANGVLMTNPPTKTSGIATFTNVTGQAILVFP